MVKPKVGRRVVTNGVSRWQHRREREKGKGTKRNETKWNEMKWNEMKREWEGKERPTDLLLRPWRHLPNLAPPRSSIWSSIWSPSKTSSTFLISDSLLLADETNEANTIPIEIAPPPQMLRMVLFLSLGLSVFQPGLVGILRDPSRYFEILWDTLGYLGIISN